MFSTLFDLFTTPAPKTSARHARPRLEGLELRDVPAVIGLQPLKPVLTNGILTVIGNDSANTIDVTKTGSTIKVLGKSFASSAVSSIVIAGEGGGDTIKVSESITQRTYLYGGSGGDTIYGGGGRDTIFGGSSADKIFARGGADLIYGGLGGDTIDGGKGSDSVGDHGSGDRVTSASTEIHDDSTLTAYSRTSFTGQVVNEVLRLVNAARAKAGLGAVSLSAVVNSVASDYAHELDRLDVPIGEGISHKISGTTRPVLSTRLDANFVNYSSAGENNSFRQVSSSTSATSLAYQFMYGTDGKGGLMNSAGHRANILGSSFSSLGLGLSGTSSSGYYLVQAFTG